MDKPAGLIVHPGAGRPAGTLVNALLHHVRDLSGVGGVLRPGIVHRLDRGTSGLMVVAKDDETHRALAAQFAARTVEKEYLAIVLGVPRARQGVVEAAIGRDPVHRKKMSVRAPRGRRGPLHLHGGRGPRRRGPPARAHPHRAHAPDPRAPRVPRASRGRGRDLWRHAATSSRRPASRAALAALTRPALHAARLAFTHPAPGERLEFESPLPPTSAPCSRPPRLTFCDNSRMDAIAWIAEQRIREAIDQGLFDNSPYRGRPVRLEEYECIAPELRMAFKVLKDAGCLPPEVELRREVASLSELLDTIADGEERKRLRREINDRVLRLEILRRHR